jgi:hypothetical protein
VRGSGEIPVASAGKYRKRRPCRPLPEHIAAHPRQSDSDMEWSSGYQLVRSAHGSWYDLPLTHRRDLCAHSLERNRIARAARSREVIEQQGVFVRYSDSASQPSECCYIIDVGRNNGD